MCVIHDRVEVLVKSELSTTKLVKEYIKTGQQTGKHEINANLAALSPGSYIYSLNINGMKQSKQLVKL